VADSRKGRLKFREIKLIDVFVELLGEEEANHFADEVDQGIRRGLRGRDLRVYIRKVWKKYEDLAEYPATKPELAAVVLM
jgi:hypothetical protein